MKNFAKLFSAFVALFTVQAASAQCPAGQAEVELDFTTDAWGYEVYWEVVPAGSGCGVGTIASGGNNAVGCNPPGTVTSGGYANSTTVNENLGCLTIGQNLDLEMTDDYGDGGTSVDLKINGILLQSFSASGSASTHPFTVQVPDHNLAMDAIYFNGQTDTTEKDVYFYQIPLRHAKLDTMYFAGDFSNKGSMAEDNVMFGVDVTGPFNYSASNNNGSLAVGGTGTDSLTTPFFMMKQMGTYDFDFYVESDSIDELPADNIITHTIEVTDTVYARDNDNLGIGWATLVDASGDITAIEQAYYINADDVASSVSISLWDFNATEVGAIIQLYVGDGNAPLYKSNYYTVQASDLNAALGADNMLTLKMALDANDNALTGPAAIPAGFYTVGLQVWGGTARVGIDPALEAAPQTQFLFYQGTWYYTTGSIYQIRLNVESDPCNTVALNANVMDVQCNGAGNGSIDLTVLNGTAPYTYNWSNGGSSAMINGLAGGMYDVTVTDNAGCEAYGSYEIDEPSALSVSVATGDAMCGNDNGSASATVSGGTNPYSYFWNNTENTSSIDDIAAGSVGVTVTDANGCTASASETVGASNSTITLAVSVTSNDACGYDMGSAMATATSTGGSVSYMWSNGDATAAASDLAANTYTVTVTDAAGCMDMASVTVSEMAPEVVLSVSTTDAACSSSDGSASVAFNTSYTYMWDDAAGQTTASATGLEAYIYTVVVTDTTTGCMAYAAAYVNNPAGNISLSTSVTDALCYGDASGEIDMNGTSSTAIVGYSVWTTSGDSITTIVGTGLQNVGSLSADEYVVIAVDVAGCLTSDINTISEPTMLMGSAMGTVDVTCNGDTDGEAMASAMGGTATAYSYIWENGTTVATATGLAAGDHDVTITDDNGCMVVETATVGGPTAINIAISSEDITCNGDDNGMVSILVSGGGAGGYVISWDNGLAATTSHTGLAANTYSVTVTDANSCVATNSATVAEPAALSVVANSTNNMVCFGANTGSATSAPSGGSIPYSFSWTNGSSSANANSLGAGTYSVVVTDANGCMATSNSVTVSAYSTSAVAVVATGTDETGYGNNDGSVSASATGGDGTYTYSWSGGLGNGASITGIASNCPTASQTFTVQATDGDGCSATDQVTINNDCVNSIEEVSGLTSMTVYPNPNNGLFNVELHSATETQYTFVVRNVIGQTVTTDSEMISGNFVKTIDLSNQTDGVYFLTVKGGNAERTAKIIVK